MHSNVTSKNVSWPHFGWTTLYTTRLKKASSTSLIVQYKKDDYQILIIGDKTFLT